MFRATVWQAFAAALLFSAVYPGGASVAGTGSAISGPAAIDTRLPQVAVAAVSPNTVLQTGEIFTFAWTVDDDNPNAEPTANVAEIWLGTVFHESRPFSPGTGQHSWPWVVADTTSGTAHLVVRSTDAFGNTNTASTSDFTILSSVTAVPGPGQAPVFAQPTPNPFNPLTRLHFNLPADGPARLTVHDARGYLVATLFNGYQAAGPLSVSWRGTDTAGRRQAGGTYFFRLVYRADDHDIQAVRKAVLLP